MNRREGMSMKKARGAGLDTSFDRRKRE